MHAKVMILRNKCVGDTFNIGVKYVEIKIMFSHMCNYIEIIGSQQEVRKLHI